MKRSLGRLVGRGGFFSNSLQANYSGRHRYMSRISTTNGYGYSSSTFASFQTSPFMHSSLCTHSGVGKVLQCNAEYVNPDYGAAGYPFSDERINFLKSEGDAVARQPSLKTLLASPERDYLITNKKEKVPIHNLVHKAVALYFYEEGVTDERTTQEIKLAYEELTKYNENLEVVLVYLHDTPHTNNVTNEETFWNKFNTMPWLALPFRDLNIKKLKRIFDFDDGGCYETNDRNTLVSIGPHCEFIEPFALPILSHFGSAAYPFSREKVAKLLSETAKELKLDMLWHPNSVFGGEGVSQVQFSEVVGKKAIFFFQWNFIKLGSDEIDFLENLVERYIQMKDTDDEFEVIYIVKFPVKEKCWDDEHKHKDLEYLWNDEHPDYEYELPDLPWPVHYLDEDYSPENDPFFDNFIHCYCCTACDLIAFDRDGKVVRITKSPTFEDTDFPFYTGGLEKEALDQVVAELGLYLDPGKMGYSYQRSSGEASTPS